jgi:CheY-like chemotaxis protein
MPRVLIVEDEGIQALLLERIVTKANYEIVGIVDNGLEAIEAVEAYSPDIVLMDIMLKGDINGIETTKQINNRGNTAVIYVTGNADKETFEAAVSNTKHYGYLSKPIDRKEILNTMASVPRAPEAVK